MMFVPTNSDSNLERCKAIETGNLPRRETTSLPQRSPVKNKRQRTLGPGAAKGKRRHRAYFVIMYAFAEWGILRDGMLGVVFLTKIKKARAEARANEFCWWGGAAVPPKADRRVSPAIYTLYVLLAVVPPRPVQLVWKNSPRGLSTRS